jgi:nucleoside 2-deoxyribosyltransferase
MSMIKSVYLAGPITGCSYNEATDWRRYVANKLRPGVDCLSPLRGKEYLSQEGEIKGSYEDTVLSSAKAIMSRDRFDVMRADAVFINFLGAKKASIGTVMEIAWANYMHKPIVVAMEKSGNPHDHPMIMEACPFVVDNIDNAVEVLKHILG